RMAAREGRPARRVHAGHPPPRRRAPQAPGVLVARRRRRHVHRRVGRHPVVHRRLQARRRRPLAGDRRPQRPGRRRRHHARPEAQAPQEMRSTPMSTFPTTETVVKTAGAYARDLLERVLSTFLQAFIGGIVVTQPLDGSMWYAAGAGGVGAALALLKGIVARWRDVTNSASLAKGV